MFGSIQWELKCGGSRNQDWDVFWTSEFLIEIQIKLGQNEPVNNTCQSTSYYDIKFGVDLLNEPHLK